MVSTRRDDPSQPAFGSPSVHGSRVHPEQRRDLPCGEQPVSAACGHLPPTPEPRSRYHPGHARQQHLSNPTLVHLLGLRYLVCQNSWNSRAIWRPIPGSKDFKDLVAGAKALAKTVVPSLPV